MIRRLYADLKQKDLAEASAIVDLQILPRCAHKKDLSKIFRRYDSVKEDKSRHTDLDEAAHQCVASQLEEGQDSLCEAISAAKRKVNANFPKKRKGRKKSEEKI